MPTHEVLNQPPEIGDFDAFGTDPALGEAVAREGGDWAADRLGAYGRITGSTHVRELGFLANRYRPVLRTHDRFGHRADEVDYHPAWHELMALGVAHGVTSLAWTAARPGAHVARAGLHFLLNQPEAGHACPLTMTHSAVPSLRQQRDVAAIWEPRLTSTAYDPSFVPADRKRGALMGMAMTEKQGGSDVRANTTRAVADGEAFRLTGHKWFCSSPMCDAFLTLARDTTGLSCFLVPRFLPDGTRNPFFVQRLKDKLGNHANASSEIEYEHTWAVRVGEPGRGVATIIEMVHHTRLDVALGAAGLMRAALREAMHHAAHRKAFGKLLIAQPVMRNVLADCAVETEAAVALSFRLAGAFDRRADPHENAIARIGTAIGKYWLAKRVVDVVAEALECLGGGGYVEDGLLARLYREAPLGSIWEGSGNVQCLDVLRAMGKQPEVVHALFAECDRAAGGDARLDAAVADLRGELARSDATEWRARTLVEKAARCLQGALLVRHGAPAVAEAFCASRLAGGWGAELGTLPSGVDVAPILRRAWPGIDA